MDYNLSMLKKIETSRIIINTHKYHSAFEKKVKKLKLKKKIFLVNEKKLLGTAGAVNNILQIFPDINNIIILYGDNISNNDIKNFVKIHEKTKADFSIVINKKTNAHESGVINFDSNLNLKSIKEKPNVNPGHYHWVNSGIYITAKKKIINSIDNHKDFAKDIIPKLINSNKLKIKVIKSYRRIFTIDDKFQLRLTRNKINF